MFEERISRLFRNVGTEIHCGQQFLRMKNCWLFPRPRYEKAVKSAIQTFQASRNRKQDLHRQDLLQNKL